MARSRLAALIAVAALIAGAATAAGQQPGGAPTQISASGSPQDFLTNPSEPVLSADRVSRRVLAVWQVRSFQPPSTLPPTPPLARLLDENGQPLGPPFVLPVYAREVVSRPRVGGWIIVAAVGRVDRVSGGPITETSAAATVVVSADGVVGPLRRISPLERRVEAHTRPFVSGATLSKPSIAVDPRSGRAVVGWYRSSFSCSSRPCTASRAGSGVYARGIDAEGHPVTPVRRVYAATAELRDSGEVALAYLSKAHRWIAVWRQREVAQSTAHDTKKHRVRRPPDSEKLFVRRFLITGRPRGRVRAIAPTELSELEEYKSLYLVTETANGGALVLLGRGPRYDASGREPVLQLVRLGSSGVPLNRGARVVASTSDRLYPASPRMVRDPATGQFVLVYAEGCDPAVKEECLPQRILAQRLSPTGKRLDAARVLVPEVFRSGVGLARTSSGSLLLAWPGVVLKGEVISSPAPDIPPYQPHKSEILVARAPL